MLATDIGRLLRSPAAPYTAPSAPAAPPGAPIGQAPEYWVDPSMAMELELPPMGSMLDLLLPDHASCTWH